MEESIERVAARIKLWRTDAGHSLQELANRSGVSPSTIHKIERGQTVPTIGVVLKLASGLGRHPTELFEDIQPGPRAVHVCAESEPEHVTDRGARLRKLASASEQNEIGVWRIVHPPGFTFGSRTLSHRAGELILFVEEGRLDATVAGQSFTLQAGDSLHFRASSPYGWHNRSDEPVSALVIGNIADPPHFGLEPTGRVLHAADSQRAS